MFVVPFDRSYRRIVDALKAGREVEYGFLGVQMNGMPGLVPGGGVQVNLITPGGPAHVAGLQPNDIITAIDDKPILRQDDLFLHIAASLAGTRVRIKYTRRLLARDGAAQTTVATLDKSPHAFPWLASNRPAPVFGLQVDYASVLLEQGPSMFGLSDGVALRELEPNSPAAARFKTLGDSPTRWLVTAVNGVPTPNPAAFYAATAGKRSVTLSLVDTASGTSAQLTLPGS